MRDTLRIGEFSALGRVSVRMLRHYEKLGLLEPRQTDAWTGYRSYTLEQLPRLNRIIALKELGFSLQEVGAIWRASRRPGTCAHSSPSGARSSRPSSSSAVAGSSRSTCASPRSNARACHPARPTSWRSRFRR